MFATPAFAQAAGAAAPAAGGDLLTMLPMMNCHAELADGSLIRLLPQWSMPSGNLQAAYTQRRGALPAVRAWIEHVTTEFRDIRCS